MSSNENNKNNEIDSYEGRDVVVSWDGRLCIHAAECGRAEGPLFVLGREPWGDPDQVSPEAALEVVRRCPSGAMSFEDKRGQLVEDAPADNAVTVQSRGPLYLSGDLEVAGAADGTPGARHRVALCRCGQSQNKPFCDNSHEASGFSDRGAVGEVGSGRAAVGGKLDVRVAKDGPLLLNGNLQIRAASGRVAWEGTKVALCRCGHAKNKPFCDGSHKAAGFTG